MTVRGSPHFMTGLANRRKRLLKLLNENGREDWSKVKAKFAIDEGVSIGTVDRYVVNFKEAGLLE